METYMKFLSGEEIMNRFLNSRYADWLYDFMEHPLTSKAFLCVFFLMSSIGNYFLFDFPFSLFMPIFLGAMMPIVWFKIDEAKHVRQESDYWMNLCEKKMKDLNTANNKIFQLEAKLLTASFIKDVRYPCIEVARDLYGYPGLEIDSVKENEEIKG